MSAGRAFELNNNGHKEDEDRILALSSGGFAVYCSVLFLFERFGAPPSVLFWAMVAAVVAITLLFAFSRATVTARQFFVDNRSEEVGSLALVGAFDGLSGIVVLFLIAGGPDLLLGFSLALVAGFGLSGWLFARPLRKSGAYTIPEFLHFRYGSTTLRFVALLVISIICLLFLYAQIRLAGLYFTTTLLLPFELVTGGILLIGAIVALLGGVASTSRVQAVLFLLLLIAILIPAIWLAYRFSGLPIPQLLSGGHISGIIDPFRLITDGLLNQELKAARDMISPGIMMPINSLLLMISCLFALGFACLPHQLNRYFTAQSPKIASRGNLRAMMIILLIATSIPALQFGSASGLPLDPENLQNPMPGILRTMIPLAVLIASIATSALLLTTITNMISHDGNHMLSFGRKPKGRQVFLARILMILVALGIWRIAGNVEFNAMSAFLWALVIAAGCLFPALLSATRWSRSSSAAILAGTLVSIAVTGFCIAGFETQSGNDVMREILNSLSIYRDVPMLTAMLVIIPANFVTIYLVSLFTARPRDAAKTMQQLHDPDGAILINTNQ